MLEDRVLPATYLWTGLGGSPPQLVERGYWTGGPNAYPAVAGDVAQFTGNYSGSQAVNVDVTGITVGEIDFGTAQNISLPVMGCSWMTPVAWQSTQFSTWAAGG